MPQQPSDSSYAAVTRSGRRPFGNGRPLGVPHVWETLPDNDVQVIDTLPVDEDEDAAPAGNSTAVSNNLLDRQRREENWADLGMDLILGRSTTTTPAIAVPPPQPSQQSNPSSSN